jgi:pimeloyl-ACP methyl ester carboxylesterase
VRLHVLDWGGPPDSPLMIMLHGVGGNAYGFASLAQKLAAPTRLRRRPARRRQRQTPTATRPRLRADVLAIHDQLGQHQPMVWSAPRGGWQAAYSPPAGLTASRTWSG